MPVDLIPFDANTTGVNGRVRNHRGLSKLLVRLVCRLLDPCLPLRSNTRPVSNYLVEALLCRFNKASMLPHPNQNLKVPAAFRIGAEHPVASKHIRQVA